MAPDLELDLEHMPTVISIFQLHYLKRNLPKKYREAEMMIREKKLIVGEPFILPRMVFNEEYQSDEFQSLIKDPQFKTIIAGMEYQGALVIERTRSYERYPKIKLPIEIKKET